MVFVTISETYDLSTKPNKMSLIGIHTPSNDIIMKTYPGLCMNSKYCRIVKQDVTIACASMLPADPLQVGVSAGDIAPQDLFNPILYKAVSNESMSTLEARLAGLGFNPTSEGVSIDGPSAIKTDEVTELVDDFAVYYALLGNRDGFRTAAPQQGLNLSGLVPLVFDRYYNYGSNAGVGSDDYVKGITVDGDTLKVDNVLVGTMRGRAHPMPRFNTTFVTNATGSDTPAAGGHLFNGMGSGSPQNCQIQMPYIVPVYTAAILMPPCKLNKLYYRMVVRTTLEFTEVRPIQEIASFAQMAALGSSGSHLLYSSDYTVQSQVMSTKLGMVDSADADLEKIMEGA